MGGNHDPLSNDLIPIMEFITFLHSSGKSYSTINIHRSMLSSTLDPVESFPIGQHPWVVRLLKGCYNINPPRPRYTAMWNIEVVLGFMRRQGRNENIDLASLSKKLATLLAITTWLRTSELAALDLTSFTEQSSGVRLSLLRPRKSQSNGPLRSICLTPYPDKSICPVDCLRSYIFVTDYLRTNLNNQHVFVSLIHPFRPVTGNTVGRWIKSYLTIAGIDTTIFKAHSTRGAAASSASRSGMPIESILRNGDWARETTFARFYNRKIGEMDQQTDL